jgi:hypothetical protein
MWLMMTTRMLAGTHECLLCVAMQGLSSTAIHIYGNKKKTKKKEKAQPSLKSWSLFFSFIKGGSRLLQKATIINGG